MITHDLSDLISICIPTYNRADILRKNLENIIPIIEPYGIMVNISDNASTDNTYEIVENARKTYQKIKYSRNKTNMGSDINCEKVLRMSASKYAWLMSDNDTVCHIPEEIFERLCTRDYNLVLVEDNKNEDAKVYTDTNDVLSTLAGTASWISTCIIGRELFESTDLFRYYGSNFLHIGLIYEGLSKLDTIKVLHYLTCGSLFFEISPNTSSYTTLAFHIFTSKWINTILSLPQSYSFESKKKAILGINVAPYRLIGLLGFRAEGLFDYRRFKAVKHILKFIFSWKYMCVMLLISVCPRWFLKVIRKAYKNLRWSQRVG